MISPHGLMTTRVIEAILRAVAPDEIELAAELLYVGPGAPLAKFVQSLFNCTSLSPYTNFVDVTLGWLARKATPSEELICLSRLICLLGRHLTAYDLVSFHYRGANYPDALFLDALLQRFLVVLAKTSEGRSNDAAGRKIRRALRHGLLLRRRYEEHAVPDEPTSPGENIRVLPEPHRRVPDEQIESTNRRRRRLFADMRTVDLVPETLRPLVAQAMEDLADPLERRELGLALFIDRPLGFFQQPAEPDATPLLSYLAYSETIAGARLREIDRLANELNISEKWSETPGKHGPIWTPTEFALDLARIPDSRRPAVSLADARRVAADFRILRTTWSSAIDYWGFWLWFKVGKLPFRDWPLVARVLVESGETRMIAFDASGQARLEFDLDSSAGFLLRSSVELPRAGLITASGERIGV